MSKKGKIYLGLTILAIIGIVVLEMNKPKKINWFPSYATHHKIPYGSIVFKEQLQRLAETVIPVDQPPFEYLNNNQINGTYIFYNGGISFGEAELNKLLNWTSNGNTLVVSAVDFEDQLLDTLNLNTKSISILDNFENSLAFKLVNPKFKQESYEYDRGETIFQFSKIDTLHTKVLSIAKKSSEKDSIAKHYVTAIKQPFGKGEIILNLFPQAHTNYFILQSPNHNYTAGLMSYLDVNQPIYMDEHYKSGKKFYTSPMYLFLNTKELKWAYYMVLIGALIYIIFEGKRKQRAIPIIKPIKNQTLEFTRTISDMYYQNGKHKALSEHKIQHFLEYIRNHFYLSTAEIDTIFIKNLATRSNNTEQDTEALFKNIKKLSQQHTLTQNELEQLNTLIETFKSNSQWKTKP